jgi:pyruvate dehydrogenase E2 component (dihydrolipoamide acetyltransferase)
MSTIIRMPEVLANVTEAAIARWLVAPGDTVTIGQPLADVETDKAVVEYAAEIEGTILQLLAAEGDSIEVGAPIAVIGAAGETPTLPDAAAPATVAVPATAASAAPAEVAATFAAATAVAVASALPAPAVAVGAGSAPAATASAAPVATTAEGGRRFISPLVRRLARENGLDVSAIGGTGPNGRIVRNDISALIAAAPSTTAPATGSATAAHTAPHAATAQTSAGEAGFDLIPHSRMRKAIARRLTESKSTVPHFYLVADCRVDRLLALRQEINGVSAATGSTKVSVNDLVVKAVAAAFVDVPEANATWSDEGVHRHHSIDIAVAVSVDDGLVTPVVRNVSALSVSAVSEQIRELAGRGKEGKLKQHELEGGSFAVSNLGMFGTTEFSAIINPPQCGILAVGAARKMPVVVNDEIVVGTVMTVTLSADHRVMDGALAARWLAAFVARIESPGSILA